MTATLADKETKTSWVNTLFTRYPKEDIRGILLALDGGYTLYLKDEAGSSSKVSGYDSASTHDLELLEASGVPVVNFSTDMLQINFVSKLPAISRDMRHGPISGMSKASFDVFANLAGRIGAQTLNVKTINFIPEMLNYSHKSAELIEMISKGNAMEAILKSATQEWNDNLSFLNGAVQEFCFAEILENLRSSIKIQQNNRLSNEYDRNDDETTRSNKAEVRYRASHLHNNLVDFYNLVHWNALMVKAGNYSVSEGAVQTMKDLQDHLYQLKEDNKKMASSSGHKGIRDAANDFKREAAEIAKSLKGFISKEDLNILKEYEPGYH